MVKCPDHPDIVAAERTGYAAPRRVENQSTPETLREFAEENIKEFVDYALAGDPDILENFTREHSWYNQK